MADETVPQTAIAGKRILSPEQIAKRRKQAAAWRAANPERVAELQRQRIARRSAERKAKRDAKPKETDEERAARYRGYKQAYAARQRAENPEARKAWKKAWAAQWREKNRSLANAQVADWYTRHPEKLKLSRKVRAARRRAASGNHTPADVRALVVIQKNRCAHAFCRTSLKSGYEVDHIIPIALGGSNDRQNIQLLCPPCNRKKGATHPIDFAQEHGLLL